MTKKEAIDTLKLMLAQVEWDYPMDYSVAIDMAIAALASRSEPQWIPCSERLPKKPDNYPRCGIHRTYFLVTLESGCVKSLGYEFDRDEWQITGSPVIAWMPLPESYQAERREE